MPRDRKAPDEDVREIGGISEASVAAPAGALAGMAGGATERLAATMTRLMAQCMARRR